jgi:hypothetical protein
MGNESGEVEVEVEVLVVVVVVGQILSKVVAIASDDMSVNVGSAYHIRLRYVISDCAWIALAKSDATTTLRIVAV